MNTLHSFYYNEITNNCFVIHEFKIYMNLLFSSFTLLFSGLNYTINKNDNEKYHQWKLYLPDHVIEIKATLKLQLYKGIVKSSPLPDSQLSSGTPFENSNNTPVELSKNLNEILAGDNILVEVQWEICTKDEEDIHEKNKKVIDYIYSTIQQECVRMDTFFKIRRLL